MLYTSGQYDARENTRLILEGGLGDKVNRPPQFVSPPVVLIVMEVNAILSEWRRVLWGESL